VRVLALGNGRYLEVHQAWCRYCHQWVDVDDEATTIEPTEEGHVGAAHPDCQATHIDGIES
jgi:hypothetical protein